MSLSVFEEKALMPTDEMLIAVLSEARLLWDDVVSAVDELPGGVSQEWKFYSKAAGWSCVVKNGKRTILYLIPQDGFFKVNFTLGEKAVIEAQSAELPEALVSLILDAKQYMEGSSFMFDVRTSGDMESVRKLITIKSNN